MPDWIEDAARRVKEEQGRRETNEKAHQATAAALAVNGERIFENLLNAVEKDVELFAAHFPDAQKKLQKTTPIGNAQFQVIRQYTPTFFLQAIWDKKATVKWTITGDKWNQSGMFEMKYSPDGGTLCEDGKPITYAAASQKLIAPALEGLVWPTT
jgi:hypothetical protein